LEISLNRAISVNLSGKEHYHIMVSLTEMQHMTRKEDIIQFGFLFIQAITPHAKTSRILQG
jgi:hypothetical protein